MVARSQALASCPQCYKPRTAVCPYCQTASNDFPPADLPSDDSYSETGEMADLPSLICSTCDEPFQPGYLRRCEWCGHDFGEGLDGQFVEAQKSDSPFATSQRRVMAVGLAMVAAGVIAAVYFLVIVRS